MVRSLYDQDELPSNEHMSYETIQNTDNRDGPKCNIPYVQVSKYQVSSAAFLHLIPIATVKTQTGNDNEQ